MMIIKRGEKLLYYNIYVEICFFLIKSRLFQFYYYYVKTIIVLSIIPSKI